MHLFCHMPHMAPCPCRHACVLCCNDLSDHACSLPGVQVRNLRWLDFRVPLLLVNKANQANQLYPHAVSLMESVRTYDFTCERIAAQPTIAPLVSAAKMDCQTAIQEVRRGALRPLNGVGLFQLSVWHSAVVSPYTVA